MLLPVLPVVLLLPVLHVFHTISNSSRGQMVCKKNERKGDSQAAGGHSLFHEISGFPLGFVLVINAKENCTLPCPMDQSKALATVTKDCAVAVDGIGQF